MSVPGRYFFENWFIWNILEGNVACPFYFQILIHRQILWEHLNSLLYVLFFCFRHLHMEKAVLFFVICSSHLELVWLASSLSSCISTILSPSQIWQRCSCYTLRLVNTLSYCLRKYPMSQAEQGHLELLGSKLSRLVGLRKELRKPIIQC